KVRRLLRVMVTMHWLDRPQSTPSDKGDDPQGDATALAVAREGIVLLKNDGDLLPLDAARIHTIVLIGPNAAAYVAGGGSSFTHPLLPVTLLVGMRQVAAANLRMIDLPFVGPPQSDMGQFARTSSYQPTGPATRPALAAEYFDNPRLSGTPALKRDDTAIDFDWKSNFPAAAIKTHSFSVRWTATIRPPADGPYIFATRSDDGSRVLLDGKTIINDWSDHSPQTRWTQIQLRGHDDYRLVVEYYNRKNSASMQFGWGPPRDPLPLQQRQVVAAADAVIVCVGTEDTEGSDRPYNLPLDEDHFIAMAAAVNRHCVVIVNSGGNVAMSDWIDRVPALIQAWYPGQAGGRALAEILFGIVNPSGHLPDTFEKDFADSPAYGHYPGKDHAVDYAEGIYVGYRWYDTKHISPRFPFGFGLSYTTFSVGDLKILPVGTGDLRTFMVTADVTNTGHRAGATVIQLYVRPPPGAIDRPYQELKAFARVQLGPGRTKTVSMQLNRRSFAYWDTTIHDWKTVPGDYTIALGQSSRDIACVATLKW
ncbi:MAG TPA: glycoside hydrolase family 3 C-terminal domain-containing protein, partial [Tepidisphaeraceae bacterium]|nr:glycoside hydrolase family 3 C-terminal domain-containing protein [Tepidisphaeraceae bacterium]